MTTVQKTALWFGILNLVLGLSAFFGPFVTGNEDGLINIDSGQLFGVFAVNWAHALVLLAFGIYGIVARHMRESATGYFQAVAVVFGLLALLALVAQLGWLVRRGPEGTLEVLSIATNTASILLHLLWAAIGIWFGWFAGGAEERQRAQRPAPAG